MTTNKQQLVVIWIAAIYFAVLGSSFLLRSYYHKYHHVPYINALTDVAERNLKRLSAGKDYATSDPAEAKMEEALDKVNRDAVDKYEQSLWDKMRQIIFRTPDALIIGLPFMLCLGVVILLPFKTRP